MHTITHARVQHMLRINLFLQEIAFGGLIVVAIGIAAIRARMEATR